jgi:hypothetical protein
LVRRYLRLCMMQLQVPPTTIRRHTIEAAVPMVTYSQTPDSKVKQK